MMTYYFVGWVVLILYVLLETDAVPKWAKLLHLKFLKYEEYEKQMGVFGDLKYRHFIQSIYPNFFVSLVTCQECLCVWLNIVGFILIPSLLGGWGAFGVTTLYGILGIAGVKFVLRKIYE